MRWEPHPYQVVGVQWVIEHFGSGIILDPGMGKTSIALAAIDILLKAGKIHKVLVVAPLRVCKLVWPLEIQKWDDFNHLDICNLCELEAKERIALLKQNHQIYLINPESLKIILDRSCGQDKDLTVSLWMNPRSLRTHKRSGSR